MAVMLGYVTIVYTFWFNIDNYQGRRVRSLAVFAVSRTALLLHSGRIHLGNEAFLQTAEWTPIATGLINDASTAASLNFFENF
jgi:hypothetical protein